VYVPKSAGIGESQLESGAAAVRLTVACGQGAATKIAQFLSYPIRSPGWQSSAAHRASRVENLIAFACPFLRMDKFTTATPTASDSSTSVIPRPASALSRYTRITPAPARLLAWPGHPAPLKPGNQRLHTTQRLLPGQPLGRPRSPRRLHRGGPERSHVAPPPPRRLNSAAPSARTMTCLRRARRDCGHGA